MVQQTMVVDEAKTWTEPQLTVLVRNSNEEAVLNACKTQGTMGGASNQNLDCGENAPQCNSCQMFADS